MEKYSITKYHYGITKYTTWGLWYPTRLTQG